MKTAICPIIISLFGLSSVYSNPDTLNRMLDERVTANEKITKEFIKEAEEAENKEQLVPLEKKLGAGWVEYLKYVRSSKDSKLKTMVLRLEYLQVITESYYELEYEESKVSKVYLKAKIASSKKKLKLLEELAKKGSAQAPLTKDKAELE